MTGVHEHRSAMVGLRMSPVGRPRGSRGTHFQGFGMSPPPTPDAHVPGFLSPQGFTREDVLKQSHVTIASLRLDLLVKKELNMCRHHHVIRQRGEQVRNTLPFLHASEGTAVGKHRTRHSEPSVGVLPGRRWRPFPTGCHPGRLPSPQQVCGTG